MGATVLHAGPIDRRRGRTRLAGTALVLGLVLAACGADGPSVADNNDDDTTPTDTQAPADDAGGNGEDGSGDGAAALGTASAAVDGTSYAFDVVACARDLVIPEAGGTITATLAGVAPATSDGDRGAVRELLAFGNGLASIIETVLPALEPALTAGPVLAVERFETVDGDVTDSVRLLLPQGDTIAAVGELDARTDGGVSFSGSLPAVSRASGQTTTPNEGDDVGTIDVEASCE